MTRFLKVVGLGVILVLIAKRLQAAKKVYAAEVSSGSKPIEAVGTSIAAFVGL
jgi:hypothetical protein